MLEVRARDRNVLVVGWEEGRAIGVVPEGMRHSMMERMSSGGRKGSELWVDILSVESGESDGAWKWGFGGCFWPVREIQASPI